MTKHSGDAHVAELRALLDELMALRHSVLAHAAQRLARMAPHHAGGAYGKSAHNLAHYLALRRFDLRPLQERLARLGLSSLGRGEAHIQSTIDSIIDLLARAVGAKVALPPHGGPGFTEGNTLLVQNAQELFGAPAGERQVRIMVTLPVEAAADYDLVLALVREGMDCARINCAHDNADLWQRMVGHVRRAARELGRECRVLMDLGGHKLRTGPLASGPAVHHIRPQRDAYGRVVTPAQLLLGTAEDAPAANGSGYLHLAIPVPLHARLQPGDRLYFDDGRGKRRHLAIIARTPAGSWLAHCVQSAYLSADAILELRRQDARGKETVCGHYTLTPFAGAPLPIRLYWGDHLLLRRDGRPGTPAARNADGAVIRPASIGCTLPAVIGQLKAGDPVWFDDGKLGAEVVSVDQAGALLKVVNAGPKGVRLGTDKGMNFPKTRLNLPPLADKDLADLEVVCAHADLVGFSFVETLADMDTLMAELARRGRPDLPIIAKIETGRAVRNLPDLILGTIGRHRLGIMIARGDLAVEVGSVRMAEIQEEILWLCEAGHVPVIWATQVLETLAKKGMRSRPELTDAAMGVRAECVMLNKGPYVLDAVRALNNILACMQTHQHKKVSRLRALGIVAGEGEWEPAPGGGR